MFIPTFILTLQSTITSSSQTLTTQLPAEEEVCCSGTLGYASNSLFLNYPCQNRPCCNSSDTVAVVAIDFAMGFRFQCMVRADVSLLAAGALSKMHPLSV